MIPIPVRQQQRGATLVVGLLFLLILTVLSVTAIKTSGLFFPVSKRLTVNLAPADLRKEGPAYDLPIAVGVLANTVMKLGLAVVLGAPRFRAIAGGSLALMLVAVGGALLLYR